MRATNCIRGGVALSEAARQCLAAVVLAICPVIASQAAVAQKDGQRSGEEVVDAVCIACHGTGANGAPRIGDQKAWSKRAAQGLTGLTKNALNGIRQMPAHGGNPTLSDLEIERAITYMVNHSGGHWVEPASAAELATERTGAQVVKAQCAKCHETGVGGAPKIGDRAAWIPRFKRGLDLLVRSAINGHGPMPPRGGMADLTDAEIRSAIIYMYDPTYAPEKGASAALPTTTEPNHRVIDDTEIYLGVVPAQSIRAQYPAGSSERSMHGGVPAGKDYFHVNISAFDSKTRLAITDAQVEASVGEPGAEAQTKKLELVTINGMKSYGNYFRMPGKGPYTITVRIRRPGAAQALEAGFEYKPF